VSLKLDLGCGQNPKEGFVGVDISKKAKPKVVHDLRKRPWPWKDNSVEEVFSAHFFEHLSGPERMPFMDELWRVMKVDAKATIITPYWSSMRAVQDPTHSWPPVCEATYLYFNKKWREDNKLSHYPITCDFDFTFGYGPDPDIALRSAEFQQFALKHYTNAALDLHVTLTKRGPSKT
jgi:hypothetical protein